ncbi:MAG: ABC transporter substrate-binding protein [Betaproteobacteria bacterium]
MTDRRRFIATLGATLLARPGLVLAQTGTRTPHISYLSTGSLRTNAAFLDALKDGLREVGYVDGKTIVIDVRWAGNNASEFPRMATSLVQARPSAIITTCIPSTRAVKNATGIIPVVMSVDGDPVRAGLVSSYARPGGNVTGASTLFEELIPKWLELITVAVPGVRHVAILSNPDDLIDPYYWGQFEEAAQRLAVNVSQYEASTPEQVDRAFARMKADGTGALVVMTEAFLAGQMQRIVALAARDRIPAIYGFREFAEAGGLMSYGFSYRAYYKRVARYVDAVLKGSKPADLPVEQPTKIQLTVNQRTAMALHLSIPQALLLRADEVLT